MILVDKNIEELVLKSNLITNYNSENLGCVSYDLTIDKILKEDEEVESYILKPQEFVFIKTNEKLNMPNNLVGKIEEKNSLMRLGLEVSGPVYQPGHKTYCFLRMYNYSSKEIELKKDFKIAQIFFETLNEIPRKTYDKDQKASFNNEEKYLKYGKYENEYKKIVKD